VEEIQKHIQSRLRGILSFLVLNGYFPYDTFNVRSTPSSSAPAGRIDWANVKVSDLFEVKNVYLSSLFTLKPEQDKGDVPLFRPTSTIHNLVAGWIKHTKEAADKTYSGGSLMVSTDGEGSHTFSYVTPIDFIPNSNTAVLVPKQPVPLSFRLFIAAAISNERWRYSYGRKPKSGRLKNLILKVPLDAKGAVDFNAFEEVAKSCPEYPLVESYFNLVASTA
ncbi:MAG: restriction endonuclease subunit S, partial [Deltaproteobacteria bacterium]